MCARVWDVGDTNNGCTPVAIPRCLPTSSTRMVWPGLEVVRLGGQRAYVVGRKLWSQGKAGTIAKPASRPSVKAQKKLVLVRSRLAVSERG